MNRSTICLLLAFMQVFAYVRAEGKYTVIAPGTIHSNDKYTAAVAVHHVDHPCQIKVGITGPSYNETKVVEVKSSEIKNVDFDVPVLEKGDYNLTAEGVNCFDGFKNTTKLFYAKFDPYVRIQTDKGLYKPGDEVKYRIVFLDKDLKPATVDKSATVWFEDGKRNRVKEIKDLTVTKGVYTGTFQISEFPVMGHWHMGISSSGGFGRSVMFDVEKYVLPKFIVKADATDNVSVKDGEMQVVVRANYTYGKPLNGKATVILTLGSQYYSYFGHDSKEEKKTPPTLIKTTDMVQGKAKIDLNVKELEAFLHSKDYSTYASIVATVEEEFTGVKINATDSTQIYPYRYSMHCAEFDMCHSFEADKEKEVIIKLSLVDGTHLADTKTPVELVYTEVLSKNDYYTPMPRHGEKVEEVTTTQAPPVAENRTFTFKAHMNETGFAIFRVSLPDLKEYEGYSHYYNMEAHYRDEKRDVSNAYQYREPKHVENPDKYEEPKEYFKIKDKYYNERPKLFKEDHFTINSSKPLSYFDYNIVGRGNILKSGHVELADKPKVYNLTLTPDIMYAPHFSLYVYYVDEHGEYHYAEETFYVEYELQNKINITAAEQVKPGEEVALKIKTAPHSFVALTAVDQSVLLLRSNNDLRHSEFGWTVGSYSTRTPDQGGYSHYPGSSSGCVTLTNGDYFYNWTKPDYMMISLERGGVEYDSVNVKVGSGVRSGTPMAAAAPGHSAGYGGSSGSGGAGIQVRKDFSETWLFDNIENTEKEEFTWSKKIPDTITSWVVSAFAMNSEKGLAVTEDKTKITTFQPFFISIRLPYSVKRGEVINVPALVFNYLSKDLDVEVTLDNSAMEFEFTEVNNEISSDVVRSKSVRVPANGAAGVSFMIRPKVLGNVMLKYTAVSPVAGDAIHKSMKVVPEGITKYANRAYFVNLKNEPEQKTSFELELPEDIVPDSQHVEVGVVGDILGPVVNNLDRLVRLPTGCGEQTMSSLLPNYLVMKYLENSKRLTPTMETKLRYNMETGYQHMLNYRHHDGSFSSFGSPRDLEKHYNGSTWLTAYVVRSLQQLKDYVKVDQKIVDEGLEYLIKQQAENGSFTEKGGYFYISQANHVSLTSSVVLAFMENQTIAEQYANEIQKALSYIAKHEDASKSLHAQAIAAYTLNKAKHSAAPEKLSHLSSLAKTDGDRKWWSSTDRTVQPRWWLYVYSSDVEISSYILLTLLNQPNVNVDDVFPIIRWLVAQRNSYGGFSSTQDTVVGLQALIQFAKLADYQPAKMVVDIASKGGAKDKHESVTLNEENGILYHNFEMPDKTKSIDYTAKGTGTAMVQIAYQYNVLEKDAKPSFVITTTKHSSALKSLLMVEVCAEYQGEGDASNMAVFEINTPSGYVVEEDSLAAINAMPHVSNTELKNADSLLVVYFDHLYKNQKSCVLLEALKSHAVAMQKPASIVLYDYYDTSKKATDFYEVESKLCDICEGEEECSKCK